MPNYVVSRLVDEFNRRKKCLNGSTILTLGISYKADMDDTRESPGLELLDILRSKGAEIYYNDPFVPKIQKFRKYDFDLESRELTEELLSSMDAVLITTNHSAYDYDWIVKHSQLVIDTRNATRDVKNNREKIIKA